MPVTIIGPDRKPEPQPVPASRGVKLAGIVWCAIGMALLIAALISSAVSTWIERLRQASQIDSRTAAAAKVAGVLLAGVAAFLAARWVLA